jgi:hypothetical protein
MFMRKLSIILMFLLSTTHLLAQVGIGTNTPNNSAMLEVKYPPHEVHVFSG